MSHKQINSKSRLQVVINEICSINIGEDWILLATKEDRKLNSMRRVKSENIFLWEIFNQEKWEWHNQPLVIREEWHQHSPFRWSLLDKKVDMSILERLTGTRIDWISLRWWLNILVWILIVHDLFEHLNFQHFSHLGGLRLTSADSWLMWTIMRARMEKNWSCFIVYLWQSIKIEI